jgi:hypothetical protein
MKLHEVAEAKPLLLSGYDTEHDTHWSFVVRKAGEDGSGRPVLYGKAKTPPGQPGPSHPVVAIVLGKVTNGKRLLVAIHYEAVDEHEAKLAAEFAVDMKRKGYGPNPSPSLNWHGMLSRSILVDNHEAL